MRKVGNVDRNIIENALSLAEKGMGLHKKYLSDTLYENKRNVRKVDKSLKYELRTCEMEAMNETYGQLLKIWKMQRDCIIIKHCIDMLKTEREKSILTCPNQRKGRDYIYLCKKQTTNDTF